MIVSSLPISSTKTSTTSTTTVTTQGHILLLSHLCYTTFGPSYYAQKRLNLTSTLTFADTILTDANLLFLHNIRHLSLTIDEQSLYDQAGTDLASKKELVSREVSRLSTLLKWHPELANGLEYVKLTYQIAEQALYIASQKNPDAAETELLYEQVERDQNACFTKFGKFLWAKVMKCTASKISFSGGPSTPWGLRMRTMDIFWERREV